MNDGKSKMCRPDEICDYLSRNHVGEKNAVFSKELEQRFSVSDRSLRRMISALRKEGHPICSGRSGYYLGETREETEKTAGWLQELAGGIADAGSSMEQIARKPEGINIFIIVGGPDMTGEENEKIELAQKLMRFFEENDAQGREYASERAKRSEAALREVMQMLDSGLLLRAIIEVTERVCREERSRLKRLEYERMLEDLKDYSRRQRVIRGYEALERGSGGYLYR